MTPNFKSFIWFTAALILFSDVRTVTRRRKLTIENIAEAFERIDTGEPIKSIAFDYGVNPSTLTRHLNAAQVEGANYRYRNRIGDIPVGTFLN